MLKRTGRLLARWSERFIPDSFVFSLLLTFATFLMGILIAGNTPLAMIEHWYNGFWELLTFGMQMVLILVTGHALANTPAMKKILIRLSAIPKSQAQAIYLTGFISCILALIHWGFGLIGGGTFALYVARSAQTKGFRLHYPLVVASAYLALLIWHNGLSGSGPLLCATPGHFLESATGLIPISDTLFSRMNILITLGMLVLCPLIMMLMSPTHDTDITPPDSGLLDEAMGAFVEEDHAVKGAPFSIRLENSTILMMLACIMGFAYLLRHFMEDGVSLNLNMVNFIFLMLGAVLWKTPIRYVRAIADATRGVSGVILQFPFYAGIMGMMKFSGLIPIMADWFVAISSPFTYPFWVLVSAALVNLFVPSGGGQIAVQGPILVEAAGKLGVSIPKAIMALAYGDELTNMIQPFWAIALLAIARLKPKDIMGYCVMPMFFAFIIMAAGLLFIS
jgi:short-chain fatty acids transporter